MLLQANLYGQPAMVYTHSEGVEGIAKEVKERILNDFKAHIIYRLKQHNKAKQHKLSYKRLIHKKLR
ncbi:Uncharacterised protein [Capnocytophaga granulosa]|nr:hypothetical protein [Capnocytophaga granulosa]SUX93734.1 Uncharacterised protein [Capnocytophaga granulosa]